MAKKAKTECENGQRLPILHCFFGISSMKFLYSSTKIFQCEHIFYNRDIGNKLSIGVGRCNANSEISGEELLYVISRNYLGVESSATIDRVFSTK